ncbi:MAG: hypothetical protein ACHP84_16285, partial [Caulobacterales bacterium]
MSSSVLSRRLTPKRGANLGWYIGVPLATVAVVGAAIYLSNQAGRQTVGAATVAQASPPPAAAPLAAAPVATGATTATPPQVYNP